jgi:uncharacterized protein YdaU (DUF1376 family)
MKYFRFHLGDYTQATAHLTWLEDAAYNRLLRVYYANEAPLPGDLPTIFRLVQARTKGEKEAVVSVLNEFFFDVNHEYRNKRADAEIEAARTKSLKSQAAINSRWVRTRYESDTDVLRDEYERNTNQQPTTNTSNPLEVKDTSKGLSPPNGADPLPLGLDLVEPPADPSPNGGRKPKPKPAEVTADTLNDMAAAWNDMAREHGLGQVSEVTAKRATMLRARINERWKADPVGKWGAYLKAIAASPFLRGENQRAWKANFDWAIRPDSPVRVAEGRYSLDGLG